MPTQAEVLEAIRKLGWADYRRLREYFGLGHLRGNSNLPQRINALLKRGDIVAIRFGKTTIFMPNPDDITCTREEAEQILKEWWFKKKKRGMPKGMKIYREESIAKILNIVHNQKIVSFRQLQDILKWRSDALDKYLTYMVKNGLIFEIRVGKSRLFTRSLL